MTDYDTQLAVIGAGPGGYAAAFFAADIGMQVTLIDPEERPGGVCPKEIQMEDGDHLAAQTPGAPGRL